MKNEYELTTIKDIFDKVPADKMAACLDELSEMMRQAKILKDSFGIIGQAFIFPDSITWIDDSKGEVTLNVVDIDSQEKVATMKTTLAQPKEAI